MDDITYEIVTGTPLSETGPNFFTGNINGLLVTVEHISVRGLIEIRIGASGLSDDEMTQVCQYFRDYIDSRKSHLQIDDYSICILLQTEQNWHFRFTRILEIIETIGFDMNISSGCYLCGETGDDIRPYEIESLRAFLCPSCAKKTADDLCANLQEKTANNRFTQYATTDISETELYLPGAIAAIVGALSGMVIWFLLSLLPFGYLPAGIGLAFCIFYAYRKFALTMKVRGLFICLGILFVAMFFGFAITLTPQIVSSINAASGEETIGIGRVFFAYLGYVRHPDVDGFVFTNLILGIVGAGVTVIAFVFSAARSNA
ncbi:MAG: hypothetical protein PHP22_07495 [Oscillospiraceae bacterium]|nr:hypothetical protein [Oscillospiraceae bacterium]